MSRRLLAVLGLLPGVAPAMQSETTWSQRCARATVVLAGEVSGQEVRWTEEPDGGLETVTWVLTEAVFRGQAELRRSPWWTGDTLALVQPGGERGGVGLWVEDLPSFAEDGRYLLLLEPQALRGWQVVGGEGGAVRLRDAGHLGAPGLREALEACSG